MQIQLWNLDRVAELFVSSYDELADEIAALVPLRRIWVIDNDSSALLN